MDTNFHTRIKDLCKLHKITIRKLEEDLNFGHSTINKWKDNVTPSIDKVIKVAEYFNVSLDYLTGLSEVSCNLSKALEDKYISGLIDIVNEMSEEERNNMKTVLGLTFPHRFK